MAAAEWAQSGFTALADLFEQTHTTAIQRHVNGDTTGSHHIFSEINMAQVHMQG